MADKLTARPEKGLAAMKAKGSNFKSGKEWKGNAGGKPVGTRNKLQGDFVRALANDFERFGVIAIARCRRNDPVAYVKVVASLMPKEIDVGKRFSELSDDELAAGIAFLRSRLEAAARDGEGTGSAAAAEPAGELPSVH